MLVCVLLSLLLTSVLTADIPQSQARDRGTPSTLHLLHAMDAEVAFDRCKAHTARHGFDVNRQLPTAD